MKIRILTLCILLLILLSACSGDPAETGTPFETTTGADETTTDGVAEPQETDPPSSEGTREEIILPKPYIDVEFKDGTVYDRMEHVDCNVVDSLKGSVVRDEVRFGGREYQTDHFSITSAGGVLRLEYRDLDDVYDLYGMLVGGYTMEAFLVNHTKTDASSAEQCMISSTQSGGYNFTVYQGKFRASVYAGKAYRAAEWPKSYDTEELVHLVGVYDANARTITLYVNGERVATNEAPGMLGLASGDCYKTIVIGGDINGSNGTDLHSKSLDVTDFKLYRTPFSERKAAALYARAVEELTGEAQEIAVLESDSELSEGTPLFDRYPNSFAEVYTPKTALVNAPTVLLDRVSDVNALANGEKRPATAVFDVKAEENGTLYAYSGGKSLGTLYDAVKALNGRIIPAFRVEDAAIGKAVAGFVNENYIGDAFVISSDAELLRATADATFSMRPILDCTGLETVNVEELATCCQSIGTKTVMLRASVIDPALVTRLRARSLAVVAVLPAQADLATIHTAVHAAISGIVTDDHSAVLAYYEKVTERTLGITPLIVAHRGDMENCPENTLRSLASAAESGATSIEFDVWLTKDGHLVLNHDAKTTHCDRQLDCKASTRAELEELFFTGANAIEGDKLAFLDEVFALFAEEYPDKILTIEVKDAREVTVDAIAKLAKEYGVEQQIILIGMNHLISIYAYSEYGLAVQMNQSQLVKKDTPDFSLRYGVIESTRLHSSCFTQHTQENAKFMEAIGHRLVKYSTWTSSTLSSTRKNYLCGATEYTSNFPHAVDDFYRYLTLTVDADGRAKILATTYKGEEIVVTGSAELVVLSGEGSFSGGTLSGSGTFCFRVRCSVPNVEGSDYYLYTGAVTR